MKKNINMNIQRTRSSKVLAENKPKPVEIPWKSINKWYSLNKPAILRYDEIDHDYNGVIFLCCYISAEGNTIPLMYEKL